MKQGLRGGFKAEREFGFQLEARFPGVDLSEVDTDGAALIVHIDNPRALNLFQLSRVLIGAAKGGVKTAVIDFQGRNLTAALPLFNFWALVDENTELKDLLRVESLVRAA
ncbi:hypothetical protein [Streptomyces sp. H27-H5]|uniref:hypothetical protein n=1 Tax=Streptomyces sp. H27-H5 TaxID=2996460 RepID=UPI0022713CE9|nr:hypothetical protein [Streptomyces sp. H27-H5]MCY0963016.1 hypothetical protein [Streptomyces sp. H27-H5]